MTRRVCLQNVEHRVWRLSMTLSLQNVCKSLVARFIVSCRVVCVLCWFIIGLYGNNTLYYTVRTLNFGIRVLNLALQSQERMSTKVNWKEWRVPEENLGQFQLNRMRSFGDAVAMVCWRHCMDVYLLLKIDAHIKWHWHIRY